MRCHPQMSSKLILTKLATSRPIFIMILTAPRPMRKSLSESRKVQKLLMNCSFCALEAGATHVDTSVLGSMSQPSRFL